MSDIAASGIAETVTVLRLTLTLTLELVLEVDVLVVEGVTTTTAVLVAAAAVRVVSATLDALEKVLREVLLVRLSRLDASEEGKGCVKTVNVGSWFWRSCSCAAAVRASARTRRSAESGRANMVGLSMLKS